VFAVVVATAACIRPSEKLACGNDVCPLTNVCIDNAYCVVPDAVAACDGKASGQDCTFDDRAGHCVEHSQLVCEPALCGDNILDDELHEQCDGTAPFATQCVDLGFDLGRPTCSEQCGIDVTACTRFGWTPLVNAPAVAMWTDGSVIAYVRRNPSSVEITGGGLSISQPGSFLRVTGGGGRIYAWGESGLWTVEANALVAIDTPFSSASIIGVTSGDDGALYALAGCDVYRYRANAWAVIADDVGCPTHIAVGPSSTGARIFVEVSNVLYEVMPTGNLKLILGFSSTIRELLVRTVPGGEMVIVSEDAGVTLVPTSGAVEKEISSTTILSVAANERFVYLLQSDGLIHRWDGKVKDRMRAPAALLTDDRDGHIYAFGGPIYRFSGLDFGELTPPTLSQLDEEMTSIVELPDGSVIAASSFQTHMPDLAGADWIPSGSPLTPNSLRAITGLSKTQRFISGYFFANGQPTMSSLWREQAPDNWQDVAPGDPPFVDGLWMDPSGNVFAAGRHNDGRGFLGRLPAASTTWASIAPASCEMYGVHARSPSRVVAVGGCAKAAVVWVYDGSAWSELHREPSITAPLRGVRVTTSGDIFAIGDGGAVWLIGTTWQADPTLRGRSISGDDADIWAAGAFTSIEHWDGARWSRMTTRQLGTTVIAASKSRVIMPGAALGHVVLLRDNP
jgi:hypothetical protein